MLIGYVSDERYLALADVLVELEQNGECVAVTRSTARGGIRATVEPGPYRVTLVKDGFGSKIVDLDIGEHGPYQFRLLSDRLLGYVWPRWSRSGDRAEFRVHSPEPYRLSLWRYGLEREQVRLLGWYDEHGPRATVQLTPDGDYTQSGVGWNRRGYGSPHHTQLATAPEESGLYFFHARGASGAFFSFPWVVAPAAPRSSIAVLASTNTWNAYNNFGGRSNYINSTGLPGRPTVNARLELQRYAGGAFAEWRAPDGDYAPLSFERPEPENCTLENEEVTTPIAGRSPCHLAAAEWRLLGWLEREGLTYDLYAEYQLHAGQLDLDAYRILILSVHPEYWSRKMYDQVEHWVHDRGGRLMYLGGNGLNCEVEFPDPHTMRCKSQLVSADGAMRTVEAGDTEACFESRFHRTVECEANLLGVVCTETGIMTAAPYNVIDGSHWVFEGTGLRPGDVFGENSLHERCHGGASGHETDKMSDHSPSDTVLLAKGLNPDDGGAEMVLRELQDGGRVFSVGSITYPASLLVDENVSRITRNVVRRFLGD